MEGIIESTIEMFRTLEITEIMQFISSVLLPTLYLAFRKQLRDKLGARIERDTVAEELKLREKQLEDIKSEFKDFLKDTDNKYDAISKILTTIGLNSKLDSYSKTLIMKAIEGVENKTGQTIDAETIKTISKKIEEADASKKQSVLDELIAENKEIKSDEV